MTVSLGNVGRGKGFVLGGKLFPYPIFGDSPSSAVALGLKGFFLVSHLFSI